MTIGRVAIASGVLLSASACGPSGVFSDSDQSGSYWGGPAGPRINGDAGPGLTGEVPGLWDGDTGGTEEDPGAVVDDFPRPPSPPPVRLGAVVTAAHAPPPISGGTLAVSADGAYAVAADPDRDRVHVVRLADRSVRDVVLEAGAEPGRVVIDPDLRAHVVLRGAGAVARIDLAQATLLGRSDVCVFPRGILHQADTDTIVVACASGDLVTLTADAYAERTRVFVERDLRDVVRNGAGQLFVTRYRSAEILALAADGSVARRLVPKSAVVDVAIDTVDGAPTPSQPTMSPTLGWRTISTSAGVVVMLHQRSGDGEVMPSPGGYGSFGGSTCGSITGPTLTGVADDVGPAGPTLDGATLAVDLAVSADGNVAVAVPGAFLQGTRGTVQLYSASFEGGESMCASPSWENGFNDQVTSVAFGPDGTLYAQSREPAELLVAARLPNVAQASDPVQLFGDPRVISLSEESARDTGHDLFHADVGGGLACASCHGEVMDDAHVWTFAGFGPRRTQTMRGGLRGTEPFHWEGDMKTFQHLVDEVMTGRMGGFVVDTPYADALAGWIDKQPALTLPVEAADAVARGKALFSSAGCTGCHAGEKLTNNASVDVGTGGTFQVPSLRGLAMRAPYMHDGCATTLRDRFSPACGGSAHGDTSKLGAGQITDLVTYLESL